MVSKILDKADELKNLGFTSAANKILQMAIKKRKLALAYEHFRYVRQDIIAKFNHKLMAETAKKDGSYKYLNFTSIENYPECPPDHVLADFQKAKEFKCFDYYEVAHIAQVKDPILFGLINDCDDRFFIAQWDDDVKIEDILMANEG